MRERKRHREAKRGFYLPQPSQNEVLLLPWRAELVREFDPGSQVSSTCRWKLLFTHHLSRPTPWRCTKLLRFDLG